MNSELPGSLALLFLAFDLLSNVLNAAFVYARPSRLGQSQHDMSPGVASVSEMLSSPLVYLSLRVAQDFSRLMLAAFALLWLQSVWPTLWHSLWGWIVVLGSGLIWAALEFIISGFVSKQAEDWALRWRWVARFWVACFAPVAGALLKILPDDSLSAFQPAMTEEDLRDWVSSDSEENGLQAEERRMIYSIFQFGETLAREIMVPRIDVTALDVDTPLDVAMQTFASSGHSRVPVYEETVDNIIGLLYAKDLLLMHYEAQPSITLRDLLRPAYFIPETKKADELLAEMQSQRIHMAIVVDEYGGFAGLVTLEDIVEEIVGEIMDEYDQTEEQPVMQISPDEYLFLGRVSIDDFNEIMQANLSDEEADTLAGFLYDQMGRVPVEGESVTVENLILTVEQVSGRRIRRIRAARRQPAEKKDDSNANDNTQG